MSFFNENISIKIREICLMSWDISYATVSPRPYHALALRLSGSADFTHKSFNLSTNVGDVFYMPANYAYSASYKEKNEILVIHFDSDTAFEMENFKLENSHTVSLLFREAYDIWTNKEYGYYYAAMSVIYKILEKLSVQQIPSLENKTIKAFNRAIEFMEESFADCYFSINETVSKANMSHTYFCRLFKNKFNTTPIEYLKHKRLIYAEQLLSMGKYTIKEIAEMSGFYDVKYFSRVFKKEYGIPPSNYISAVKR